MVYKVNDCDINPDFDQSCTSNKRCPILSPCPRHNKILCTNANCINTRNKFCQQIKFNPIHSQYLSSMKCYQHYLYILNNRYLEKNEIKKPCHNSKCKGKQCHDPNYFGSYEDYMRDQRAKTELYNSGANNLFF